MPTEYQTIEGTSPFEDQSEDRDLRVIKRIETDSTEYMMTEIEDGVFVQWSTCNTCRKRVAACTCTGGPTMPDYMTKWRDERVEKSLRHVRKPVRPEWKAAPPEAAPQESKVDGALDAALEAVKAAAEQQEPEPEAPPQECAHERFETIQNGMWNQDQCLDCGHNGRDYGIDRGLGDQQGNGFFDG